MLWGGVEKELCTGEYSSGKTRRYTKREPEEVGLKERKEVKKNKNTESSVCKMASLQA